MNKRGINSCSLNRWEDRVELFPPLRPCSPHRHHHMRTTWRSLCGEAVTPQGKKQHSISSPTSLLLLLTLSCFFLQIPTTVDFFNAVSSQQQRQRQKKQQRRRRRRSWFLSSLPVQPVMTARGMLLVLYRPLKITHPSLPSMAGLTASCSQ